MKARRQRLTAATVKDLVEAFLASKEALAWRPKKILNHAERDVTAVYDRHSYDPEKRSALEA